MTKKNTLIFLIISAQLLLISCGGSTPASFYLLTAKEKNIISQPNDKVDISIGIDILEFPDYLGRSQIVSFSDNHQLKIDEFNRWGEPLKENFSRVLLQNLSNDIPTDKIFLLPNSVNNENTCNISIVVTSFEMNADSVVTLSARWSISQNQFLIENNTSYSKTVSNLNYEGIVAVKSSLISDLSITIAEAIREKYKMK